MALYSKPFMAIVEDVMLEMRETSTETSVENKYKRRINDVYMRDIPSRFEWDWLRTTSYITLSARYNTGTVSVTNASATVTGSSTVWTSSYSNWKFTIPSTHEIYTFTYASGTTGTISPVYQGSTASGLSYILFQDTYDLATDYGRPTNVPGFYYDYSQGRADIKWKNDEYWYKHFTTQPSEFPIMWRECPTKSSAGLYRVEINPPVTTTRLIPYEYIKALAEMDETTDTAKTGSTTTKVLTTNNLYGKISVGQYFRADADYQWVKISAIATDTTSGNGITVDTLKTAPDNTDPITISDAPDMPYQFQEALFYGGCYLTALEQGDKSAQGYLIAYVRSLDLDMARRNRKRYGRQYMKHYIGL